jgi:xanthine dehydrogenase accessory factor
VIIALSHDPKLDDMALMEALRSDAFYVGALGSRASQAKRRERLLELDLAPEQVRRLHGPVGYPLGGKTPPEIALAILAEVTALRHGITLLPAEELSQPAAEQAPRQQRACAEISD